MNDVTDVNSFLSNIDEIIDKKIKLYLQTNDCLVKKVAKIATADNVNHTATVYFPPFYDVESTVIYENKTGVDLATNDYVYLFTSYSNPDQGWLMVKK